MMLKIFEKFAVGLDVKYKSVVCCYVDWWTLFFYQ